MENKSEPAPAEGPQNQPSVVPAPEAVTQPARDRKCLNCGTANPTDAKFCYKCGTKIPDISVLDKKICAGCRAPNALTSRYCYKCGLKLPEQPGEVMEIAGTYAGFWRRLAAIFIDSVILVTIATIVLVVIFSFLPDSYSDVLNQTSSPDFEFEQLSATEQGELGLDYLLIFPISVLIAASYFTITVGRWGKTLGKAALGLRVVRADGSRVSYGRAFGRYWGYMLNILTLYMGFLTIAFNQRKQGLHDLICDTVVNKTT